MAAAAKAARALAPLVPNSAEAARQPLRLMAHYNRWAHEKLHDALRPLSREELHRDTGLVFKNCHSTMAHIWLANELWLSRTRPPRSVHNGERALAIGELTTLWTATDVDPTCWSKAVPADAESLFALLDRQCGEWVALVEDVYSRNEEEFFARFEYATTKGKPQNKVLGPVLMHVFNHATHHRGQVSAALTRLGRPAPALDLLYFLEPKS